MSSTTSDIDVQALMRGLVHELRNPLSAILTASSLLQPNQTLDEESEMLIGVVQKESRRMNRILTEFSSFVKPPAPSVEDFDLAAAVRDTLHHMHQEELLSERFEVRDELPTEIWARGDKVQTTQVLRHIINNAIEAMQDSGHLRLTQCDSHDSSICIEDSGAGLGHGAEDRAFQPFFSTKPASTGLGLSISRGLLRAFGGELQLENIVEHGSTLGEIVTGVRVRLDLPPASSPVNPSTLN